MKKLKTLTIVRHGDYSGENLNSYGMQQMENIAKEIKEKIGKVPVIILTSAAPRAKQSADVIGKVFDLDVAHVSESFWSDNRHYQDDNKFLEELENNIGEAEHAIVVSHLEYVEYIPAKITRSKNFPKPAAVFERSKGTGVHMNMTEKIVEEIRG